MMLFFRFFYCVTLFNFLKQRLVIGVKYILLPLKPDIYIDSFKVFLITKDNEINVLIQKELAEIERQNSLAQQEEERKAAFVKKHLSNHKQPMRRKVKTYPRANIAFKCNYCDGRKTTDRIGFSGLCSDSIIRYNIGKAKHIWCSSNECPCRMYYDGDIKSYKELKEIVNRDYDNFVCYESIMLNDWKASAGVVQTGENKGRPMRLKQVQLNSLAVLTTRLPNSTDSERFIFAVFLVDESYEGDDWEVGYVTTESKYRIEMTLDEAKCLRFWNYYLCHNAPDVIKFGSGLHRYLSDEQAAQILIVKCSHSIGHLVKI